MDTNERIKWLTRVEGQIAARKRYEAFVANCKKRGIAHSGFHPYDPGQWREEYHFIEIEDAATRCATQGLEKMFDGKTELALPQLIGGVRQLVSTPEKELHLDNAWSTVAYLMRAGFFEKTPNDNYRLR